MFFKFGVKKWENIVSSFCHHVNVNLEILGKCVVQISRNYPETGYCRDIDTTIYTDVAPLTSYLLFLIWNGRSL